MSFRSFANIRMETYIQRCAFCEIVPVYRYTEDHCEFNGKVFCMACIGKLTTSVVPVPNKPQVVETSIPENATISLGPWDKCPIHSHKSRLLCSPCNTACCVLCVPLHDGHRFLSIEDAIVELTPILYQVDFLAKLSEKDCKDSADTLNALQDSVCKFFGKIQNKPPLLTLRTLQSKTDRYTKRLKGIVLSFAGKSLADVVKNIKNPHAACRLDKHIHWALWNSTELTLMNLQTMTENKLQLPEGFKFPHFCRTIFVSPTEILACGGRTEANSYGLRTAFVFNFQAGTGRNLPEMASGRANHCLLYFGGKVYVIGGCDHENKYTNRVERLCLQSWTWERVASTNEIRDSTAAVGLELENAVYVFGGRYANQHICDTIEKYLVSCNVWVSVNLKLSFKSMVLGAVKVSAAEVLIFAGQDANSQPLKGCNIVDLKNGTVIEIERFEEGGCIINEPVFYEGKVVCYVFDGVQKRSVHIWKPETRCWDFGDNNEREENND
jgi:hypothetical protein